jgi:AraC-like DNA-binding protein
MDPLSPLFERFTLSARVFFAGLLCQSAEFERRPGLGTLHVLRRGRLNVAEQGGAWREISEPSVLFYPRPLDHGFRPHGASGAELTCASIDFGEGVGNPVLRGLPDLMLAPLDQIPSMGTTLDALFDEAFAARPGRQVVLNRLLEYVLVLLLRHALATQSLDGSVLTALGDPRLSKSLMAMHERPEHPWSLGELALAAGMSRARFAVHFLAATGVTPMDYLTDWRLSCAKTLLRRGQPLKTVAPMVGYSSSVALTRAFSRRVGVPPAQWLSGVAPAVP